MKRRQRRRPPWAFGFISFSPINNAATSLPVDPSRRTRLSAPLPLFVGDDKLWQTLTRVIDHINDAVVSAWPCQQGLVGASLPPSTVILLVEPALTVAKVLTFPDLAGLERVAAQNLDKQQVVVRAILVRLPALDVRGPVEAARVVISESARVLPRERVR